LMVRGSISLASLRWALYASILSLSHWNTARSYTVGICP
jgi:hypothetical protein